MAVLRRHQPVWIGNTLNATCPLQAGGQEYPFFREAAAQTFKAGDILRLDSAGEVAIATVNGSNQLNSRIAGIAKSAASGIAGQSVHFHAIRPDDLFAMGVFHSNPTLAVTNLNQLGTVRAVIRATVAGNGTDIWSVDIENSVAGANADLARVKIVGFLLKNMFDSGALENPKIGDTYGIVVVKFLDVAADVDGNPALANILQLA